jgi:hypothetical protein
MTTSPHFAGALPRLVRLTSRVACAIVAGVSATDTLATDVGAWHYAAAMPDSMLQIGGRRLHLPPGHWTLVTRFEFSAGAWRTQTPAYTAWAVRIEDNEFRMAVAVSLPTRRLLGINRWGPDPCLRRKELIFQRTLSSSLATPECLSLEGSLGFMQYIRYTNMQVADWFEDHKFKDIDGLIHILYTKNYNTTFGRVSVVLPIQAFESDVEAIRWANTLPGILGPFIDADVDDATLPEPAPAAKP